MKRQTLLLLIFIILCLGVFYYRGNLWPAKPCTVPIEFSIGTFDARFGLSQADFIDDVEQAGQVWTKAEGSKLFSYNSKGTLKINLIYDKRQQVTNELKVQGSAIDSDKAAYDVMKSKYDSLVSSYNDQKSTYENDRTKSKINVATLNSEIKNLNSLSQQINETVPGLNALAQKLNMKVTVFNTTSSSNGEEFDEGEYILDSTGPHINIYQFTDKAQLLRVLTHELGHALGLDHVSDPEAIMYRLNTSKNETPTSADIMELKRVCIN